MCLIVFAWRPSHSTPLVVAGNRDEFYVRPTAPLAAWEDVPGLYAGRDLEAGGTWLGVTNGGRFAALTNIRDTGQMPGKRSRGELVAGFLAGVESAEGYLDRVASSSEDYSGFNLLLGDGRQLFHINSQNQMANRLEAGVYGLSNASLDTPWPKLARAREALEGQLADPTPAALLALLNDAQTPPVAELPDTGVGLATEQLLSSIFIASPNYGTRASTALIVHADGRQQIVERSFGAGGVYLGEVELTLSSNMS